MNIAELIRKKRNGEALSQASLAHLVSSIKNNTMSDAQIAAFAMAVYFQGLTVEERVDLTMEMAHSGEVLHWALNGPVVDKHSTGGVGDTVSLLLAPALAAAGAYVPMVSGRGLGHTGGTLDKLASIPGYTVTPDKTAFQKTVKEIGCAIIGQTAELAPADARFYAVRDVTATVESLDLITASILSKKLAAGLDALILDVKCGNGAFMRALPEAKALARSLVSVANGAGCKTAALISDMNEPLARVAGNAVEVQMCADLLLGKRQEPRFMALTIALCAEILALTGLASSIEEGQSKIKSLFASGHVAERFDHMIAALGGPTDFVMRSETLLEKAPVIRHVKALDSGVVSALDTYGLGMAVIALGGGRKRSEDKIDLRVGFDHIAERGQKIEKGSIIAIIHARDEADADMAEALLREAIHIGDEYRPVDLIKERLS